VLVLCDLLGGTPFNVASAIARRSPRVVCLSGANLAMAVEAALADGDLDDALVERLLETGRSGIVETERNRARRAS
jgi:PTS system N-acetylgalactosamine-specific IIA component